LDLDEEVAFDGGGAGVVDLGLVLEDDGEFGWGLGVAGHDFDVLVQVYQDSKIKKQSYVLLYILEKNVMRLPMLIITRSPW